MRGSSSAMVEQVDVIWLPVSDMGKAPSWDNPGESNWVDAKKAYYVIGSRMKGGMGTDETVPFSQRAEAERFASQNGGREVQVVMTRTRDEENLGGFMFLVGNGGRGYNSFGENNASIFQAIHEGKPDQELLSYQCLQMLPQLAQGEANKIFVIPSEFSQALGNVGGAILHHRGDA